MPRVVVEPVRVKRHDDELGCKVLRVVAYRARCGEHWRGPSRETMRLALDDGRDHLRDEHAP